MKYSLFLTLAGLVHCVQAADSVLSGDEINKKLIYLVSQNNIVNQNNIAEDINKDGKNLKEMDEFIGKHREHINFDYAATGGEYVSVDGDTRSVTSGMGGPHTALQLACLIAQCSHLVVKLLCDNGAKPVKGQGLSFPATHCFGVIGSHYDQYGQYDSTHALYNHQLKKLQHLKDSNKGLLLDVDKGKGLTRTLKDLKGCFEENNNLQEYMTLIKGTVLEPKES